MTAMRKMSGHKVALLAAVLWLSYSVVQCVGCPGSDSAFLRCRHAGSEAVAAAASATATHADCHKAPAESEHSQPSCDECCGTFVNRTALNKENAPAKTVTAPLVAVLPALPAEIVALGTRALEPQNIRLAPRTASLFLLFRSLLL